MNSQVCVNCRNEKPVNLTDNRLVTESCGHVKCMDCLLHEKTGCLACLREKPKAKLEELDEGGAGDSEPLHSDDKYDEPIRESQSGNLSNVYDDLSKKKKPETSHIRIETDANGRCYVCTVCKKKFHARSQVAYHAYCNGQRKPYQCPDCNKSFATHSHYKYHMRVHRNERTYACDVCGDSFFQMSKLQRHKLKHTTEKKYVCSECNKAFNNVTSLRKHALTHTEERPYSCAVCGRRFRDSSNYRKHVAKHDKKCVCGGGGGWCKSGNGGTNNGTGTSNGTGNSNGTSNGVGTGNGTGTSNGTGNGTASASNGGRCSCSRAAPRRQHQCPRCPQAFHSNKDMRRHAAVHTDSKPFRCKVCNRRFRRKDNLERHIRNTHPDYVPASAVECDELALKQIAADGPLAAPDYQHNEKTKLQRQNPLPPLTEEVIQKHMHENGNGETDKTIDKSYILSANNARQSVIVVKKPTTAVKSPAQECEYVHKIRKASIIPLPPIDVRKMLELEQTNLELGAPPKDKKKLYEKILRMDGDKKDDDEVNVDSGPGIHWRRKIKQSVSIDMQ